MATLTGSQHCVLFLQVVYRGIYKIKREELSNQIFIELTIQVLNEQVMKSEMFTN